MVSQLNPSRDLWMNLFGEEAPPSVNLSLTNEELINFLKDSFLENKSDLTIKNINYTDAYPKKLN